MGRPSADYQLLSIFAEVAEHASFTRAAHRLGVGKGTVSRAVAELERQLGADLLHRTTHRVALSTAGLALYERVRAPLAALDEAVLALPERAVAPSGELRITAPPDFGSAVLPGILVPFGQRYPEVKLDVRLSYREVDLVAEGFDLAIRPVPGRLEDSALIARRVADIRVGCYAAPSYLSRRGNPTQLGDPCHDWILHPYVCARGRLPPDTPVRVASDDFLLLRALAVGGGGVALLPRFLARPLEREGRLQAVTIDLAGAGGTLYLVYPSSGQVPRKVSAFCDFLVESVKNASPF